MADQMTGAAPSVGSLPPPARRQRWDPAASSRAGWIAFASITMVLVGCFHAAQGLVAIFDEDFFLVTSSGLTVSVDYTAWGWTHLVAGAVVGLAGLALFSGATWARVVAVAVAAVSAVVNFSFLAAYPFWSVIVIALDVMVILALTVHGDE